MKLAILLKFKLALSFGGIQRSTCKIAGNEKQKLCDIHVVHTHALKEELFFFLAIEVPVDGLCCHLSVLGNRSMVLTTTEHRCLID